jgi:pyruvate formate lyase activating enzyme
VNTNSELILEKVNAAKPIFGLTPFTLLDYPNHSACILWFAGCNMRCLYCYNPEIVLGKGKISADEILLFLKSRQNLLDAVVFSGGECLIHKHIINLICEVKKMGFLVKIDTNGSTPETLQKLLHAKLIDYVALDFKATSSKFKSITKSDLYEPFTKSLELLLSNNFPFEVRTTLHSDLLTKQDLSEMIAYLETKNYRGNYYIQYFKNHTPTLSKMEYSNNDIDANRLSTQNIKVVIRD